MTGRLCGLFRGHSTFGRNCCSFVRALDSELSVGRSVPLECFDAVEASDCLESFSSSELSLEIDIRADTCALGERSDAAEMCDGRNSFSCCEQSSEGKP